MAQGLSIVQPQHLDVGDPEAHLLDRRQHLRQGRGVAAGEDVFAQPGVGAARRLHAADRMQQHDAVVGQKLLHLGEVFDVVRRADMLEHADRDDAIVAAVLLAIVEQLEAHPVGDAAFQGSAARHGVLLLGERDAGHVDAVLLAQEQAQPAPARADVEHLLAGLKQHLGRNVLLLEELRLLERLVAVLEVGAGVLPVAIEEEVVELVLEIVVVGHVALSPADRIVLLQQPEPALQRVGPPHHGRGFECRHVAADEVEQLVDVAVFDGQRAVHVGFAQRQPRPERQPYAGPPSVNANSDGRPRARAINAMRPSGRIDDRKLAFAHNAGENPG